MMRDFREQDYYELLDVKPHASQQELENSYQRARRFFNSDSVATYALFQSDELVLLRRRIGEAYRVLIDPERRRRYDREMLRLEGEEWPGGEPDTGDEEGKGEMQTSPADELQLSLKVVREPPVAAREKAVPEPEENRTEIKAEVEDGLTRPYVREAECETEPAGQKLAQPIDEKETPVEEKDLPALPPIGEETEYTGDFIRSVREARGISLEEIADSSKISIYYLRKIESEEFGELPARVYARGYLKQIAVILGLDPDAVAVSYMGRLNSVCDEDN